MEFNQRRFNSLADTYGLSSSWAVWDPKNPENAAIIGDNVEKLTTSVIMVALNISKTIQNDWQNFHGRNHDGRNHARKLIYAFNESPFCGAYMTDLIKGEVEPKADKLLAKIRSGEINLRSHFDKFRKEMNVVRVHKHSLFILFGKTVAELFATHLGADYPNQVYCPHYAYRGYTDCEWVKKTWSKLEAHLREKRVFNIRLFSKMSSWLKAQLGTPGAVLTALRGHGKTSSPRCT